MIVAIDLDNCLAAYDGWKGMDHIGNPLPGAREALWAMHEAGHQLLIFSCRTCDKPFVEGEPVSQADREGAAFAIVHWAKQHDFPPLTVWAGAGKVYADVYIDDRAIRVNPSENVNAWADALLMVIPPVFTPEELADYKSMLDADAPRDLWAGTDPSWDCVNCIATDCDDCSDLEKEAATVEPIFKLLDQVVFACTHCPLNPTDGWCEAVKKKDRNHCKSLRLKQVSE